MITPDGWFIIAVRIPGNPLKTNAGTNPILGLCGHSAEGYEGYLRSNPPLAKEVGGRKSWHLSVLKSGVLLQNYSLFKRCWHAGEDWPNDNLASIEVEGTQHEPFTEAQISTVTYVIKALSEWLAWVPKREEPARTLHQHNDFHATACPSGRYDWPEILRRLSEPKQEEDEYMTAYIVKGPDGHNYGCLGWPCPEPERFVDAEHRELWAMAHGIEAAAPATPLSDATWQRLRGEE